MNDKKELMHDNQLVKIAQFVNDNNIQFVAGLTITEHQKSKRIIDIKINDEIIDKLYIYINTTITYKEITDYEKMKNKINKDKNINLNNNEKKVILENTSKINIGYKSNKGSTSMKYYLLKKKFLKTTMQNNEDISELMKNEEFKVWIFYFY